MSVPAPGAQFSQMLAQAPPQSLAQENLQDTPEIRYSRVLFFVSVSLLALVPLVWAAREPQALVRGVGLESSVAALTFHSSATPPATTPVAPQPTRDYEAKKVGQSVTALTLKPREKIRVWVDFRNAGRVTWLRETASGSDFIAINSLNADPITGIDPFRAPDWDLAYNHYAFRPGRMSQTSTAPGATARFYITLQAPLTLGTYTEKFTLVAENREAITGGTFTLPVTVVADTAAAIDRAHKGETVRVGIWNTEKPVQISSAAAFTALDAAKKPLRTYAADEIATVQYVAATKAYLLDGAIVASAYVTFEPTPGEFIEIVNYPGRASTTSAYNDNYFPGKLEYRHSSLSGRTWVINTLSLEAYVRGVGEVSNATPHEMQKAMTIVERTYAEYHRRRATKHASDFFHVDNRYDQVYKGAGFSFRNPLVATAAVETAGSIVTYQGALAITPYFSRSDGRTRSYREVWGGAGLPWLVGVDVPQSKGQPLLGHGVGMDAYAGVQMAAKQNATAATILQYFYTGTTLTKIY